MAQGDITLFNEFLEDVGLGVHDLNADTVKMGIIDDTAAPTASDADPRWGAGGSTNLSTNEVTPGGNYTSGGNDITNTYSQTSGTATFDGSDSSADIAQDASNPTDARWGILYNDTSAGKEAIAFIDFGSNFDMTTGDLDFTFNASGIFTIS